MALGMLNEGGCSEDELLEKCIQSFGESPRPWPASPKSELGPSTHLSPGSI